MDRCHPRMARMCTKFLKRRWSQSVKTARCATSFWTGNNDVQNARGVFTPSKVIVIMALLAVTGAILSVFWLTRRHAANAHVEVLGIDAQGGVSSPETPYYAQTLHAVNRQKLAQAQRAQGSFVPALSERTGSEPPDLELKPLEQSLEQRAQPVDDGAQTDAQLRTLPPLPAPSPGVDKQVEALVAAWDHPPQSQKILGIQTLESTAERENAPPAAHGPAGRSTTSALAST